MGSKRGSKLHSAMPSERADLKRPEQLAVVRPTHAVPLSMCDDRHSPRPCRQVSFGHHVPDPYLTYDRQRDADRAPPMVVLSLPERVWTPDIAWEKDDSSSDPDTTPTASPKAPTSGSRPPFHSMHSSLMSVPTSAPAGSLPPPPPISSAEVADPPASAAELTVPSSSQLRPAKKHKHRTKSQRYFSNDECAICMESFQRGEIVRILPCGHVFHKDECDEWLMKWRKLVSVIQSGRLTYELTDSARRVGRT